MNELVERLTRLGPEQFRLATASLGKVKGTPANEGIPRRAERGAPAPLSFEQARTWFLDQLDPENGTFNLSLAVKASFPLKLNLPALERSLNEVLRRHEVLRSEIDWIGGELMARVVPSLTMQIPLTDLRQLPKEEREPEALRLASEEARRPFNPRQAPLIRFSVLQLEDTEYVLIMTTHHIASDGRSQGLLFREIATLYLAASSGMPAPLREPAIQYSDFAVWQRQRMAGPEAERLLGYWTAQLKGPLPILNLRTDHPRGNVAAFRAGNVSGHASASASAKIKSLARAEGATLFMALLAALDALLFRYTGQSDLVVGSAVANRSRPEIETLVGMFINIIALRTDLSGNPTFRELLARVRQTCEGAYAHEELPFARLIDALDVPRDPRHHPLFQVLFLLQNAGAGVEIPGMAGIRPFRRENGGVKRDMSVYAEEESDGRLKLTVKYRADLYDRSTIEQIVADYAAVIEQIGSDPSIPLDGLQVSCDRRGSAENVCLNRPIQPPTSGERRVLDDAESVIASIWCELLDVPVVEALAKLR